MFVLCLGVTENSSKVFLRADELSNGEKITLTNVVE